MTCHVDVSSSNKYQELDFKSAYSRLVLDRDGKYSILRFAQDSRVIIPLSGVIPVTSILADKDIIFGGNVPISVGIVEHYDRGSAIVRAEFTSHDVNENQTTLDFLRNIIFTASFGRDVFFEQTS